MGSNGSFVWNRILGGDMLMKRFNEDEEGFFDEEDESEGEGVFEVEEGFYIPNETLSSIHDLEMFEMDLDKRIMDQAIKMASSSFWWKFKSITGKQEALEKNYEFLKKIYQEDREEEE